MCIMVKCEECKQTKDGHEIFGVFNCNDCLNKYFDSQEKRIRYLGKRTEFS